jgi:1,2-phenylacetyl-CoA epoxidase catalytic subunit
MWADRLHDEPRFQEAVGELWPYAVGVLPEELRSFFTDIVPGPGPRAAPVERSAHTDELRPLWEEMTMVRRSVPGATW